jgi:hypothetical protein
LPGYGSLNSIIGYCAWIAVWLTGYNWQFDPICPDLQLVNSRGTVRICCSQNNPLSLIGKTFT